MVGASSDARIVFVGTTQVVLESLEIMARLAASVPNPRVNLTRYLRARRRLSPVAVGV